MRERNPGSSRGKFTRTCIPFAVLWYTFGSSGDQEVFVTLSAHA